MLFQSKLINSFITGCLCRVPHLMVTKKKKKRLLLTGNEASLSDYVAISVCDRMRTPDNNDMCAIGIQESCSVYFLNEKPLWHKYFFKIVSRWLENHGKKKQHKNYQYIFVLFHYFGATSIVKCICVFLQKHSLYWELPVKTMIKMGKMKSRQFQTHSNQSLLCV